MLMGPPDHPVHDPAAWQEAGDVRGHFLPTLDGWRAIAIAMVLASHALTTEFTGNGSGGLLNRLTFRLGTFGVMLFFAISGFLICTRLLIEEETRGRFSLKSFYVRRIFRILPAAYVYLAVLAVLVGAGMVAVRGMDFAAAALFFSNYVVSASWYTGHFWSLAIEEHFYLFWPPILLLAGRRWAAVCGTILIALTVVLRLLSTRNAPAGADLPGYTWLRLDAFMFPCILAVALRDPRFARSFVAWMTVRMWSGLIAGLCAGIALATVIPWWREPQRVMQAALLPLIIVTTVKRPHDWAGRLLRHPAMEWTGRISYSIYLWQQLVFGMAPRSWPLRGLATPVIIAAILTLAAASRRWIELPLIGFGRAAAQWIGKGTLQGFSSKTILLSLSNLR
jgi:peptidoglycan/LPS O-acetylase OafA/YrhL